MAAFVAVVPDAVVAAAAATATLTVVADVTAEKVRGPRGFSVVLLHNALIEPYDQPNV
jgi:hydroxyethylthiazole kinase